ncbi:50S ribosomal protein L18 [Halorhodospira halochloris]|uniref:Large ribosomal subunit protein uL18 n=1 Tax=Halorhodospira halochloris TaxID=1052 RepID=A0A110B611_HALHR|nr:50S ribosomal protein L18 [Halorhodospira halochloris]MBK1652797.1 50S ribosomal protein L18 [Halorhodospira halochloris]MCG5530810.1 50S ribosomal protein L18 [Halorhodospira halochloris]MCG5549245.1 50S ribosomal protein L18 [Halorhodospira halochloris]BAU58918.1 LSU ribosomal protein L18p [Halorhodospira halochloris]
MEKKIERMRRARKSRGRIRQRGAYRLSVHRTPRHVYAQVQAPDGSRTLAAASTVEPGLRDRSGGTGNINAASEVGRMIAERAKEAGINQVAFDRSGYRYHGRIRALAEAAREAGLQF